MLNTSETLALAASGTGLAGIASLVAEEAGAMGPQDWTAMALLAAVVMACFAFASRHGTKLAAAIEANTKATTDFAKEVALLVTESREARATTKEALRDLRDAIEDIPNKTTTKRHP